MNSSKYTMTSLNSPTKQPTAGERQPDHPNLQSAQEGAEPVSLFDTEAGWRDEPRVALADFMSSDRFRFGNRSSRKLPVNHKLGEPSKRVYGTMFDKFLRHLSTRACTCLDASVHDVDLFFTGALADSTGETRTRYVRLTERIFQHLQDSGFREDNPVSIWAQKGGMLSLVKAPRGAGAPTITAAEVNRLQDWLYTLGTEAIERGDWRSARDLTLASLSMGTGMRCAELIKLTRDQVKFWPGADDEDKFEFDIPGWASVVTARAHRAMAERDCAALMECWWNVRWTGFSSDIAGAPRVLPTGKRVFPATLTGKPMNESTLFRNLKEVAQRGIDLKVLNESTRWVLERGAQGLRRAFVLSLLKKGSVTPELLQLLTERLGHHHKRSVRRYLEPKVARQAGFGPETNDAE